MSLNSEQYWHALGVPIWKLRHDNPGAALNPQSYLLVSAQAETLALVFAEISSLEEQSLLANIVNALEARLEPVDIAVPQQPEVPTIIFGHHLRRVLAQSGPEAAPVLVVCSLTEMIKDPSLKKEVWQKIRVFKKSS